jgi:tetratricopeptide (TPR) repeat protein
MFLAGKAAILTRMGEPAEACRVFERILTFDPGNLFLLSSYAGSMALARRPAEALRTLGRALQRWPGNGGLELMRAQMVFCFSGRTIEWRSALEHVSRGVPPVAMLDHHFNLMRIERRYAELQALLEGVAEPATRVITGPAGAALHGVGHRPTALLKGWVALLMGDREAAARHGRTVLDVLATQRSGTRNAWFVHMLQAQAHAFLGQREHAIANARAAIEPTRPDALSWITLGLGAAAAYAWSGAADAAVSVLEELVSSTMPCVPAFIARDPLLNVPLADDARYRAIADRAEAEMRATGI